MTLGEAGRTARRKGDKIKGNAFVRWPFGILLAIIGIVLAAGGGWLVSLGGSPYYLLAGLACLLSGWFFVRGDRRGVWIYAAMLLATLGWSLWEVGLDFWQLLPRLAGPTVLGVILALPWIRRGITAAHDAFTRLAAPLAATLAVIALVVAFTRVQPYEITPANSASPGFTSVAAAATNGAPANWTAYGANASGTRHSPASQITAANVASLEPAWTFETGDTMEKRPEIKSISFMATPLMVDDRVIFCSPTGKVFALDADSGRQLWLRDPKADLGNAQMLNCRGVSYHANPTANGICAARVISMTVDGRLLASDAATGAPCPGFGTNGEIDLKVGMGEVDQLRTYTTSPPTIIGDVAVVGSYIRDNFSSDDPSGVVRAYDVNTGAFLWGWDSARPDGQSGPGPDGEWTRGSVNAWTVFSADPDLGLVYLPTGNATPDHVGTHRTPDLERYASSIVALDAKTGQVRWHYQMVHHDIWDYDIPAQPVLFDWRGKGASVPALAAPTKLGDIFILDRRTGKPLTTVEERPVTAGKLPGERYSPTQPRSTGFASFAPPDLTEASMWGATPLDQLFCRIRFRSLDYDGVFTPPSERGMLQYPGTFGMLNWGSVSVDEARRLMIVNASAIPQEVLLFRHGADVDKPEAAKDSHAPGYLRQEGTNYGISLNPMLSPLGIPCIAPPWGHIAAVNIDSGKIAWKRTLGTTEDRAPLGIAIPGAFNIGGSVTTDAGLTFIGAAMDKHLRAFDTQTGKVLWKGRLPAGPQATPMTYTSAKTGRQYVVIAAGGHMYMGTDKGDYVVAFALPERKRPAAN
ncbi:membrane-bound PQQ-dependent dehydrogenase, glucose/quinate/shikimate family [Croceicoccus ponticola]|uniref:Membrane-bound PQQ-dependent dehydrogenase, glucose/quinate/shikimate family n=1 Tax=Croceicoccus ponticola TaxID=2217664 RepID=A0A437GU10_9SPHN|nr:membrane-bound PQQ-dependent dehydrogenase, glucose/quinate/shikimate family [Croceicoccus ponticola]RVQ64723.1 membrane-bound PQQ-dependent dehydrogenase, glucose/quinate/shikimate family [Croceicoccus ponticola]